LYKYEVGFFLLALDRITFWYGDPREADPEDIEKATRLFDSCIELSRSNGAICRLYVLRDDLGSTKA